MLEHGGRLRRAAHDYGIALEHWLDLSTGINPHGYPVPAVPAAVWQRLPEDDDGLEAAAAAYYGSAELLPTAGSQAAIQALPAVLAGERVSVLTPSYAEHAHAWRTRTLRTIACAELPGAVLAERVGAAVADSDVVVLVQPNNPSATLFERARVLDWQRQLASRGGWLVVDEAFIDPTPAHSVVPACGGDGLVVLRSLGKFFGLAGARVGFVFAPAAVRAALAARLGPWALSGPARHAARCALTDFAWQEATRRRLAAASARLAALLRAAGLPPTGGTALFQWVVHPQAERVHAHCARHAILTRYFDAPRALRFGLPAHEDDWQRLQRALGAYAPS